jgi:O-antigen ligase
MQGAAAVFTYIGLLVLAHAFRAIGSEAETDGFYALAGVALVVCVIRLDPAWLLTAGLLSTMFAAHWALLGLPSTIGMDRILFVAGALAFFIRRSRTPNRPPIPLSGIHFLLGCALAFALISAVLVRTLTDYDPLLNLVDQYGALPFFMFLIAPAAYATNRQRQILVGGLVAAGAYLSLTALLERLGVTALVIPHYISNPDVGIHFGRARGPFIDAGADGLGMFTCVVAGAIAYLTWERRWTRSLAAAVIGLGLVGILLTETRGVWLAAVAGISIALVTTEGLRRFLLPVAAACVVLVVASFGLVPGLAAQVQDRLNSKASVYERDNLNAAGLRMLETRPLLGFGWGKGNEEKLYYFRLDPNIPLSGSQDNFSNLFLQYAVDLGLVGFALWTLATGAALLTPMLISRSGDLRRWQPGLKALVVAWVAMGLTAPTDYVFSTLAMWTWAGVVYGAGGSREASTARGPRLGATSDLAPLLNPGSGWQSW